MKTLTTLALLTIIAILFTELASAQPGLPSEPSQAPIDGGLALLATVGGGHAIK